VILFPDAVLSRSARLGTVVRGYQLPAHLEMDHLESLVDADLEEELELETRSAFETAWRKTAKDLQSLALDSDHSDLSSSIKSASPSVPSSPLSFAEHDFEDQPEPHSDDLSLAEGPLSPPPLSTYPETPRRSQPVALPDDTIRQSNNFRLKVVGSRRGPQKDTSPLQSKRGVSRNSVHASALSSARD
jgi:hypothetical protein